MLPALRCRFTLVIALVWAAQPLLALPPAAPGGGDLRWQVGYDAQGRTAALTDPAGRVTRLTYEQDGQQRVRRLVMTGPDGTVVTRDLDERGRLVEMRDGAGSLAYGYDDLGRLNRVEREGAPALHYTHDTADRIKTLRVGDAFHIGYTYDFRGRLESIDTPAGPIRYAYLAAEGQVVRDLPNGLTTVWRYAPDGTLETLSHLLRTDPQGRRGTVLCEYTYSYWPDGLIAAVVERTRTGDIRRSYQYDQLGRLERAQGLPRPQYVYGYDTVGNRTQTLSTVQARRRFGYDWAGRLTATAGAATAHDAAGNLTALTLGGKTWTYGFDSVNRLVSVSGSKARYRYDGDGNLIERTVDGQRLTFVPDPLSDAWRPLVTTDAAGERTFTLWDGGTPLLVMRQGQPEYLLHDHLGSVRLIADRRGQVMRRIEYEPFGVMEDAAAAKDFAPRFAGLFWDPAGEVYLTRARAYAPALGRFLQVDPRHRVPTGAQEDLGLYAYCGSDPQNFVDATGATRTAAEQRTEMRDRTSEMTRKQREMQEAMRFQQMEMRDRQRAMLDRIREQSRGVATRQWQGAVTFRDDLRYVQPRVTLVMAANLFELGSIPFGGALLSFIGGAVGAIADRTIEDIFTRTGDNGLKSGLERPRSIVEDVSNDISMALLSRDLGKLLLNMRSEQYLIGRAGDWIEKKFDVEGNPYTLKLQRDRYRVPWDETVEIFGTWSRDEISSRVGENAFSAGTGLLNATGRFFRRAAGQGLNFVGESSNWIGENRSGGALAKDWQKDALGRLPLGETTVGVTGKAGVNDRNVRWDEAAKWHDVQDYVNWHAPGKGIEVKVPWGNGEYRYFMSRGRDSSAHDREVGRLALDKRLPFPMTDKPSTAHPVDLAEIKARFPVVGTPSFQGPTSVGGVYLGGSGQALDGVGLLDGITLDANNNLILLNQGGQQLSLPPLRLDDVVTIFRSVYLHGEAPSVSIDPNPDDPKGSAMIIRHGQATAQTYVGWVLFQADRLMKGYTLGADNDTGKTLKSGVPGFGKVLDTLYFGGGMPSKGQQEGHWERFWIVPAQTNRLGGERQTLTLFDVPLKVKTQSMKWENGKLVDDTSGRSSPGATAFTDWFSTHYEAIAAERLLLPPPESGLTKPVPVFAELRRIALITAIAEQLRDQGVPLPFWMRDYPVTPVPVDHLTPGLELTRSRGRVMARVFGGVSLAPEDRSVRDFRPGSDLSGLSAPQQQAARAGLARAARLETAVRVTLGSVEPLQISRLKEADGSAQAVALPGAQTLALAPGRLDEVDLAVPIGDGLVVELVRGYHSFFNPDGPWGKGWAFDLPHLQALQVPVERKGNSVSFQTAYEMVTPLNSQYVRFSRIEPVAALDGVQLMVPDQPVTGEPSPFYGLTKAHPAFYSGPTHELIRKDGATWHFDLTGNLVAIQSGGVRVDYERDGDGRLSRIVGHLGQRPLATIELTYNPSGQIETATGSAAGQPDQVTLVTYRYDANGRLSQVESPAGRRGYRYQGAWVAAVTFASAPGARDVADDPVIHHFDYDARGRLLREIAADGTATDYRVTSDAHGSRLAVTPAGQAGGAETVRYDDALRPIAASYADGMGAAWHYPDAGGTVLELAGTDGSALAKVTESADRRQRTLAFADGLEIASEHDEAGRLTALAENGQTLMEQSWTVDGRLRTAATDFQAEHYEYDADGLVSRVVRTPPGAPENANDWEATRFDPFGRPLEIADPDGPRLALNYDDSGELKEVVTRQRGQSFGVVIGRDAAGRVERITSPAGSQTYSYDADGVLAAVTEEKTGATASAEWNAGLLRQVTRFDGGKLSLSYFEDAERAGLLQSVTTPNQLTLTYDYDQDARLVEVNVGKRSRLRFDYDDSARISGWGYHPAP